MSTLSR